MKPFLIQYQSTKSMIPFLYKDLYQLLRDIVSKFIKPDVLEQCKNTSSLCDIDFKDTKNQLKKPEIGFGASRLLDEKIKRDGIT